MITGLHQKEQSSFRLLLIWSETLHKSIRQTNSKEIVSLRALMAFCLRKNIYIKVSSEEDFEIKIESKVDGVV